MKLKDACKGNAKECSNYHTIAFISYASKVMLKILQARLQQYVNRELPDVQAAFFFNLFSLFFNFTILYWFCHISTWIRQRYTHVPHPEPSSLPILLEKAEEPEIKLPTSAG